MKNIKFFCGRPLIHWCLLACYESKLFDQIVVATDCDEIAAAAMQLDIASLKIFRRNKENASDSASTESVMLEYITKEQLHDEDSFCLVQLTNPFVQPIHFQEALKLFQVTGKSVLTGSRLKRFFWSDEGVPVNYDYFNRPRRQDFSGMLVENGAFYINSVQSIRLLENRLSKEVIIYEMPLYSYVEIDEEDDWQYAEYLMKKHVLTQAADGDRFSKIKVVFSDVDGVLTDAGMYYSEKGDELKKFNTHDGMAFAFLRNAGIKTGIITSEETNIVMKRGEKLKVDFLFQGSTNKFLQIRSFCQEYGYNLEDIAYIGDDVNCLELLKHVGVSACPHNAVAAIKRVPGIIKITRNGGDGAFRDFVDLILSKRQFEHNFY